MTCSRSQLVCVCGTPKPMRVPLHCLSAKEERKGQQSWQKGGDCFSVLKEPILQLPWLLFVFTYAFNISLQKPREAGDFYFDGRAPWTVKVFQVQHWMNWAQPGPQSPHQGSHPPPLSCSPDSWQSGVQGCATVWLLSTPHVAHWAGFTSGLLPLECCGEGPSTLVKHYGGIQPPAPESKLNVLNPLLDC